MFELWGSILLALCGLPEAIRSFRSKRCDIGWGMILSWLLGEICLVVFAFQTKQYILLINYFANISFISIMLYYKILTK
jgi:uncharacterized membrane protein